LQALSLAPLVITTERRPLQPDELADARRALEALLPTPSPRARLMRWLWLGTLALIPVAYGATSGSLVIFLTLLLLEIAFILFMVWWTGRQDREYAALHAALVQQLEQGPHSVTTVEHGEFVELAAYGMKLWLVQADFSTVLQLTDRGLSSGGPFPCDRFQLITLELATPLPLGRAQATGLSLRRHLGQPVAPLAQIEPGDFERMRHLVPAEGELGHGRLQTMLELAKRPST